VRDLQELINPYLVDEPVTRGDRFFGRDDVLAWLRQLLGARGARRVVVIEGSRRIGKSSLLHQLEGHLPQQVFLIDLSAVQADSLGSLLWRVAASIAAIIRQEKAARLPDPDINDFLVDPNRFHKTFLLRVYRALRRRRLVLAFDEIDALEDGPGSLKEAFDSYLTTLMESDLNLSLALAVEGRLEGPSVFGEAFHWKLGPIDDEAARQLIVEPARALLAYDYHAIRRIIDLSSGHPYFIQLLCRLVFERCAAEGRASERAVDAVIDDALELASQYVEPMWNECSRNARMVLAGFAGLRGAHGVLLEADLSSVLVRRGAHPSPGEISLACQELVERDLLEELGVQTYRFRVELVRLWLRARRRPESVAAVGRTRLAASATSRWMGRFLWPLIGLLVATAVMFGFLASFRPGYDGNEAGPTPVSTEPGSALSFVLITPTAGEPFSPTPIPRPSERTGDIAYMMWDQGAENWELYAMSRDGSVVRRLTHNDADDSSPAWSHDQEWLVFVSERDGNKEVYRANADGTDPVNLTNNPAADWTPAISPDGTRIVFASLRDGNWELYLMDADGSQPARMTFNQSPDYAPAWSPDGSRIAFVSERDGNLEIYVMEADGSAEVRLTRNDALELSPAWSPDGSLIAFESYRDGNMEIYVMNADGTDQRNLTNNSMADDHGPTWTPDGLGIVFYSNRDGNWDLYLMSAQGGEARNLTNTPGLEQEPFWAT
jgi:hypothetical protein